ncbi:4'-phosphopantetheinyl transferase superfamily protein, partial [Blastococcus sp. CT_GayMR20]|uniref:4'-phosphopantetheinyl transferase family protein n=1 Tax=Blastococcus sp. CT_GayMR20 TaxID=2559609 RepID=UPI001ADDE64C
DERARAARALPAVGRRRTLLRAALRHVLGGALGVPARDVPIAVDDGRPYLVGPAGHPDLRFSCSASEGIGLIALADSALLGIDVERHRDEHALEAFADGWLTATEVRTVAGLPTADRLRAVTRCWTQKEAVLKACGVGLRRDPGTVETPVSVTGRSGEWTLAPVAVPEGFVASLAVRTTSPLPAVPVIELHPGALR